MRHLITQEQLVSLGRPIGKVDEVKMNVFITETEQLSIKPVIGNSLFLDILEAGEENEKYAVLLNGGTYTDNNGKIHSFLGLRTAISYFVYAQIVMSGDIQNTRYGMMLKNDDYSSRISSKERSDHYNNILEIANQYLKECVAYCKCVGLISRSGKSVVASGGITIRKIG